MQNEQITQEDSGFLNNKDFQIQIRKNWRAYCKSNPKAQTLTDLAYYHLLRFGHTKKCFTPMTNEAKINGHYTKDAMITAKNCKTGILFSLEYYIKNKTRPPVSLLNICGEEFLKSNADELLDIIKQWNPSEYTARPVAIKKEKKIYEKKEAIHA